MAARLVGVKVSRLKHTFVVPLPERWRSRTWGRVLSASVVVLCFVFASLFSSAQYTPSSTYRYAYKTGFDEGFRLGRRDRLQNLSFDFANKAVYQRAIFGFSSDKHDRSVYVVAFRRGFQDGYTQGYGETEKGSPDVPSFVEPVPPSGPAAVPHTDLRGSPFLPAGLKIRVKLLKTLGTQFTERGERFEAEVIQDIDSGGQTLVPKGSHVTGTVSSVRRAGRVSGRAEMKLRFQELSLDFNRVIPIEATLVSVKSPSGEDHRLDAEGSLEGKSTRGSDSKRIGLAASIGALIGILSGGKKGAAIGAGAGAAVGTAGVLATRGRDLLLAPDTEMVIRLDQKTYIPLPPKTEPVKEKQKP